MRIAPATLVVVDRPAIIEHGTTRLGRAARLPAPHRAPPRRPRRGHSRPVGSIDWWVVFLLAVGAVVLYVSWGRAAPRQEVREGSWILAVSQLAVVLVPALALVLTAFAVVALVILAVVALVLLLRDRR